MKRTISSLVTAGAMTAFAIAGAPAAATVKEAPKAAIGTQRRQERLLSIREMLGSVRLQALAERRRGPGWSFAHVKRMARKKRNQARNRRAHR